MMINHKSDFFFRKTLIMLYLLKNTIWIDRRQEAPSGPKPSYKIHKISFIIQSKRIGRRRKTVLLTLWSWWLLLFFKAKLPDGWRSLRSQQDSCLQHKRPRFCERESGITHLGWRTKSDAGRFRPFRAKNCARGVQLFSCCEIWEVLPALRLTKLPPRILRGYSWLIGKSSTNLRHEGGWWTRNWS